jgi:hypothetical protein
MPAIAEGLRKIRFHKDLGGITTRSSLLRPERSSQIDLVASSVLFGE